MDEKIQAAVQQCVEKHFVTAEEIEAIVDHVHFWHVPDTTMTVCCLVLTNGFTILGQSSCFDPSSFDAVLGEKFAHGDAVSKVGRFLAFMARSQAQG
jgi:hypothetical protein